jgi:hypothetical protein
VHTDLSREHGFTGNIDLMMLGLPKSTVFGKRMPKQKIYDNLSVTAQL